jgi:hypothetical protein
MSNLQKPIASRSSLMANFLTRVTPEEKEKQIIEEAARWQQRVDEQVADRAAKEAARKQEADEQQKRVNANEAVLVQAPVKRRRITKTLVKPEDR